MTSEEILQKTLVPGTRSVFFLGCFESCVTLYSQQVRAFNLVDAILDQGLLREKGKVAIAGGGAAGITAAAALAKARPDLSSIELFDTNSQILEYQRGSRRYLHPHIYDWPKLSASQLQAGLPFLDWQAGPAENVAAKLADEFDEITQRRVVFQRETTVTSVTPLDRNQVLVMAKGPENMRRDRYDVVILSIGFGLERYLGCHSEIHSYWTPSPMTGPILGGKATRKIFVSGNGDGGLIDFMIAAFNSMSHPAICDFLVRLPLQGVLGTLEEIEQDAWQPGAAVDFFRVYRERILTKLPGSVLPDVAERLRPNVQIWLHTAEPRLFKRTSSLLNRLGAFLVIEADRNIDRHAIATKIGIPFDGKPPVTGTVRLSGQRPFSPWLRFLRLGPDSKANLAPFKELTDKLPEEFARPNLNSRPEVPVLTKSAVERFSKFSIPARERRVGEIMASLDLPAFEERKQWLRREIVSLLERTDRPPLFYHWRQKHRALHWVDYYFVRVLARLRGLNLQPYALITDQLKNDASKPVVRVVEALIGRGNVITNAEARHFQAEYRRFAQLHGPQTTDEWDSPRHRGDTKSWVQFMTWFTVTERNCRGYAQLLWDRDTPMYDYAHAFGVKAVQIPSGNVMIGGVPAKLKGPEVLIEPPEYPSICGWISSRRDTTAVEDLLRYFEAVEDGGALGETSACDVRDGATELDRKLNQSLPLACGEDLIAAVNRLARILRLWNATYFAAAEKAEP